MLGKLYKEDPPNWRIGHYVRPIPSGYTLSILQQQNLIDDPNLNKYYTVIRNIIQDDIFSVDRIANILKMNLGFYNDLIKPYKNQSYDLGTTFFYDLIRVNPLYYAYRGDYYQRNQKYYEAIEDYRKYIEEIERYDGVIWTNLATCFFYVEDYNNAYECWENAKFLKVDLDPTDAKNFEEALNSALQKQNH
jgi:tetratricopeptide (TPR) repeat protein